MNKHKYIMALAMNSDVAKLIVGNAEIPVKITKVDLESSAYSSDMTTVECLVVNDDQIKYHHRDDLKKQLNSIYGEAAMREARRFDIVKVIFNNPATIVFWADGTKTVVKCQEGDVYSKETGMALCIAKRALGDKSNFNEVFKNFIPEQKETIVTSKDIETTFVLPKVKSMSEEDLAGLVERSIEKYFEKINLRGTV